MPLDDAAVLAATLKPEVLRRLAGKRSFDRGEEYFDEGAVQSLRRRGDGIEARVEGSDTYRVQLWVDDGEFGYSCSCPVGDAGDFCKHCVAVGLACDAGGVAAGTDSDKDLRGYLLSLDKETLATLLLAQAADDERLYRRLTLRATQAKDLPEAKAAWRGAFSGALARQPGYVDYREAHGYAERLGEVVDTLEDFLEGSPAAVIELADYGLGELEESLEWVDDSDGCMTGVLGRLQDLHLEACRLARPDPVELAGRLFEWEMTTGYDLFYRAAGVYADILGERGLAAYRRLAEADWARVPALGPGDADEPGYDGRFRITAIMATLAEADDDLDALVAAKSRDLSTPYRFLQIASLYHDAGEPDLALEWAERGWLSFPTDRQDERLRSFLAALYTDRGRHDEAMAMAWPLFEAAPHLRNYDLLAELARAQGQWPVWRERAISFIRGKIAGYDPPASRPWGPPLFADHSLLVEILLHEGDVEAAWGEALTGGCDQRLWLMLAERRAAEHPADAAGIYRDRLTSLLRNTGNSVYTMAVEYIEKIEQLHLNMDEEEGFRALLGELRCAHRRKSKLMKMLDDRGW